MKISWVLYKQVLNPLCIRIRRKTDITSRCTCTMGMRSDLSDSLRMVCSGSQPFIQVKMQHDERESTCPWGGSAITSTSALYRLIRISYPGDNKKTPRFTAVRGSQQLPKWHRQNRLTIISFRSNQRALQDKSLHDKEKVTLATELLVSLHLQDHVWFAATKRDMPPTHLLAALHSVCKKVSSQSRHKACRVDTMRHQVYMQGRWSGALQQQVWFERKIWTKPTTSGFKETFLFGYLEQIRITRKTSGAWL